MKTIKLHDQEIEYKLKRSKRARRMGVAIYCDTSVVVTLPYRADENVVERFLLQKASWLLNKISHLKKYHSFLKPGEKNEYMNSKAEAVRFAEERVKFLNQYYNFKYNRIAVKQQKTRWGSCSRKGNLNFNYRILFLPPHIADYIIVHELCHLKEFNHSGRFWALVAKTVPNYLAVKRELKNGIKK